MEKIKVLFLDQREIIGHGICSLFKDDSKIEMVTYYEAITIWPEVIERYQPEVFMVDVGYHGTAIIKNIRQRYDKLVVIAITDNPTYKEFFDLFQLGVKAYLLIEDLTVDSLRAAIDFTTKETVIFTRPFSNLFYKYLAPKDIYVDDPVMLLSKESDESEKLSTQEKVILALVLSGASNREIARFLHIAENTIKVHLRNIRVKMGIDNKHKLTSFIHTQHYLRNELLVEYRELRKDFAKAYWH